MQTLKLANSISLCCGDSTRKRDQRQIVAFLAVYPLNLLTFQISDMYHPCIASLVSVRTRGLHSFSFNDRPYCSSERYPFVCLPRAFCSCCCSSMYRLPISSNYCYSLGGAKQSSLFQWSPCRKLVLSGFDLCFHNRAPAFDVGRSCCCDTVCSSRVKSEGGGERRFKKSMVFEERTEGNDFGVVEEAEIMLDLLTEGIVEECLHVTRDARRVVKKAALEERKNGEVRNKDLDKKKRVGLDESLLISRKKNGGRKEKFLREEEEEALLRKENSRGMLEEEHEYALLKTERAKQEEERETLLRERSHRDNERQESESKLRYEMKVRARTEEREELLRRKEIREKLRKDGSSCSSYYSFSSTGDYDSDNAIEHRQGEYTGDSSSGLERYSRSSEAVHREVKKEDKMREDYTEEYGINVTKKSSEKELYKGSSLVESDFRKKSEKKLTDVSVKEMESRKNNLQKEAISLKEHETNYRNSSDYHVNYDDRKEISTSTKIDEQAVDAVSLQSERRLKYKQLLDMQENQDIDVRNSYSQNTYSGKRASKVVSSSQETVAEHGTVIGITTRNDEHQSSSIQSIQVAEVSESQKIDVRKTSVSHQSFETAVNKEEYSTKFSSSKKDAAKQHHRNEQVSGMVALRRESELLSKKQSKSGLKSSGEIITQAQNVNLAYGPTVISADLSSQVHAGVAKTDQSVIRTDETTKISLTHSGIEHVEDRVEVNQPNASAARLEKSSIRISQEDPIASASRLEKSSAHHVDEFVDQLRHENSSSDIRKETKTSTTEIILEGQQSQKKLVPFHSGDSKTKEQQCPGDDWFSGAEGPSDEMWKLNEPSTKIQPKEEFQDDAIKVGNVVIKRAGRSLWNIIGDVFRLGWSPRSESHHSGRKSGGKSPKNLSSRSETWFSTHEAEENEEASRDKEGGKTAQGLLKGHQGEKTRFQVEDCSSSSTSEGRLKLEEGHAVTISPPTTISLPSGEEISEGNSGTTSSPVMIDSSTPSPALQRGRYVIQGAMEAGEANASNSGTSKLNTGLVELSDSIVNEGKLKRRKLQRNDQIQRDRFDEWEEAYNFEAEQRKTDEIFMREAILEAQKAADNWEVPVGAVLVHNGKIIARGCNLVEQLRDSTAHAEMICIREASNILRTWRLSETRLYVTLEPCPMCAGAILQARIDTIVWGAPNKLLGADGSWIRLFPSGDGGNGLEHSDKPPAPVHPFHPKITIRRGVLASECADTMQQFFKLRRKKKDKKSESPSPPPWCLPLTNRPSKFLTKTQDAFNLMFCL